MAENDKVDLQVVWNTLNHFFFRKKSKAVAEQRLLASLKIKLDFDGNFKDSDKMGQEFTPLFWRLKSYIAELGAQRKREKEKNRTGKKESPYVGRFAFSPYLDTGNVILGWTPKAS